jgi:hypothetical protein
MIRTMRFRVTRLGLGAATSLVAVAATGAALAASPGKPVVVKEAAGDAPSPDMVRGELGRSSDGKLRAAITFAGAVSPKSLLSKTKSEGSICVRIYTAATPGLIPPDYLVCAAPDSKGKTFHGSVLAERVNALPRRVAKATVTRASQKSLVLKFSQSSVGKPATIEFSFEAARPGCDTADCADTLPNSPDAAKLVLRAEAPSD